MSNQETRVLLIPHTLSNVRLSYLIHADRKGRNLLVDTTGNECSAQVSGSSTYSVTTGQLSKDSRRGTCRFHVFYICSLLSTFLVYHDPFVLANVEKSSIRNEGNGHWWENYTVGFTGLIAVT